MALSELWLQSHLEIIQMIFPISEIIAAIILLGGGISFIYQIIKEKSK